MAITTSRTDAAPHTRAVAAAVTLAGVTRRFGDITAVDHLDLELEPGQVVAFLGPNGAGKTTSIDMMLGLSRPSAGTVTVFGMSPREAIRHGLVAAVMQSGGLLRDITVRETLQYMASLFPGAEPVETVMASAGVAEIATRKVGACSGGEQQRLRFAMALLSDPLLVILDEPTTGMDVESRRTFWETIRADAARGRTVLFATHYLQEADDYADRVVMLREGRVVADATAAEIRALAGGRTVRARLADADPRLLAALPGVDHVDVRGEQVVLHANDSDDVARYLLNHTAARDLEVTSRGLEDAFLRLTGRHDQGVTR